MKKNFEYLLGDSNKESRRLQRQSKLWDPVAFKLFDRLEIRKNWQILEIGPGQGSIHLELRRRAMHGRVDAVERSEIFADHLKRTCVRQKLTNGTIYHSDLYDVQLKSNAYDLVFVRWVFLFLPDPQKALKKIHKLLKPGGLIAIQDYHRETLAMIPAVSEWPAFLAADRAFFASNGGNASIGSDLPNILTRSGFKMVELEAHTKMGHPGSLEWNWLTDYFLDVMPRYAKFRPFSDMKAKSLTRKWNLASRQKHPLLIGPTVLDIVAKKQ